MGVKRWRKQCEKETNGKKSLRRIENPQWVVTPVK
jgi:hypothetical protein